MAVTSPFGVNLRATAIYVTDGANEVGYIGEPGQNADYPIGAGYGHTVGNYNARDRDAGLDRRLAGTHWNSAGTQMAFRIDLPSAGTYDIRAAFGDAAGSTDCYAELFDDTSSLGTLATGATSGANTFKDATGVERTAAAWPGSNASVSKTFSTTILIVKLGNGTTVGGAMAHFSLVSAGGGASALPIIMNLYRQRRA